MQRLRDTADERRVLLQLTPPGRALKAQALAVPEAVACAAGCKLDELTALTARLKALRDDITRSIPTAA